MRNRNGEEEMQFSIIIPVYNVEKFLRKCLDAIVEQKFSDYEVILIDDRKIKVERFVMCMLKNMRKLLYIT